MRNNVIPAHAGIQEVEAARVVAPYVIPAKEGIQGKQLQSYIFYLR